MFREEYGIGVRVYNGKRIADDSATLASIRNGGDAKQSDFELRGNMKVGDAEKLFKDVFGITIQIEDSAGKLVDNNVTIASLKTAKDVKAVNHDNSKAIKSAAKPKVVKTDDKAAALKATVPELNDVQYFKFGSYYQENSSEKTPIEWLVLKKTDSKVLLLSRYGLDCKQYHHEYACMTWEKSDLRNWLNGEFLSNAFSPAEQEKIAVTKLANDDNPVYGTFGGANTEDRVFLLSIAEADSLFNDDAARKCVQMSDAVGIRAFLSSKNFINGRACCYWWLRSPGSNQGSASAVQRSGTLDLRGEHILYGYGAVRPALWVNL
jgi:hypothetical protein